MFPTGNPYQMALLKYMYGILQHRYVNNANIISRISHYLVTESDLREFSTLMQDVFETAYAKALQDYHTQLKAGGIDVAVSYAKDGLRSDGTQ